MLKQLSNSAKTSLILAIIIISGLFLFCFDHNSILNKIPVVPTNASSDAIAIRVIPNHQHYSAMRWYKEQGFTGSPQSLIIDGYEAIRDGRTIYVNAANIVGATLYTNIYLLSYSQSAEPATIEIVNQLLQHWHFNTDLSIAGQCIDPEGSIGDDCLIDSDCPTNEYCDSDKAKTTRDTRRLADLAEVKIALEDYKDKNNRYPDLAAGSYIPNNTLSTWPSWQGNLAQELSITLPIDPINKLGQCDGYDQTTCWNDQDKEFADPIADDELNLPADSRAYVYAAFANGASSTICAVMESGLVNTIDQGACAESESWEHAVGSDNNPPVIAAASLPVGYSGEPYEGFVNAYDPDGDSLIWTFVSGACAGWSADLRMEYITENQKIILATNAGAIAAPSCDITITVTDNKSGPVSQNYTIDVIGQSSPVINPIANQTVTIGNDLAVDIFAVEADSQYPLSFNFTGKPIGFNSTGYLDANEHDYHVSGTVLDVTKTYNLTVTAYDTYDEQSNLASFTVTIENQAPIIDPPPALALDAIACLDYVYDVNANDPDGHSIEYFDLTNSLPADLSIDQTTGEIIGQPQNTGVFPIQIEAQDQYYSQTIAPYSAEGVQNYDLTVSDEVFTVTAPADNFFYVAPAGVPIANLYYLPVTFFGAPVSSAVSPVNWSRTTIPAVPSGLTIVVNSATGVINATADDNAGNPGFYDVTVAAENYCGASANNTFTLEVRANEWCGDGVVQAAFGEICDSDTGGQDCTSFGFDAGTLICDSSCDLDSSACCNPDCAGRECGPDPAVCLGSCPPGCGPNASCSGAGLCYCNAGWAACDGSLTDANGCEININTDNNNCGACGVVCGPNSTCLGGTCVCSDDWTDCDGSATDADGCECDTSVDAVCVGVNCVIPCLFDTSAYDSCDFW